ncbi:MAG: tetratricopeptide repeat protein [Alphaproteobacteria bacterium]
MYGIQDPFMIAYWSAKIQVNPQDAEAYYYRGSSYFTLAAHYGSKNHKNRKNRFLDKAIADLTEAIKLNPDYSDSHYERGRAYAEKGNSGLSAIDFNEAISQLTVDISRTPDNATLFHKRANVYREIGNYDRALADYSNAIELNPSDHETYNDRATLYSYHQGDYGRAINDLSEVIRLSLQEGADGLSLLYGRRANLYYRMASAHSSRWARWTFCSNEYADLCNADLRAAKEARAARAARIAREIAPKVATA